MLIEIKVTKSMQKYHNAIKIYRHTEKHESWRITDSGKSGLKLWLKNGWAIKYYPMRDVKSIEEAEQWLESNIGHIAKFDNGSVDSASI